MLKFIKSLFGKKQEVAQESVPYKVEAPAPTPIAEQATQAVVESIAPAKKPAAKKTAKPKAPRKPKAPKAPK